MLWGRSSECLRGKWGYAILACLLQCIIMSAASSFQILLFPITAGLMLYFLLTARGQYTNIELLFRPFNQYGRMLWGCLRPAIFVFLWSLLLIIPGIIAGLRYTLTIFIMLDEPQISVKEAMTKSGELMRGHKLRLFGYQIIFFFLVIFSCILTLGIAFIWIFPFTQTFMANFYLAVKGELQEFQEV